ncbi:MAG: hypothetical protein K9N51_02340 [Candidatus Pacebacteria bacterium]|nr:hypothetical protein [Candidatus Paceibacterota bacterium]
MSGIAKQIARIMENIKYSCSRAEDAAYSANWDNIAMRVDDAIASLQKAKKLALEESAKEVNRGIKVVQQQETP